MFFLNDWICFLEGAVVGASVSFPNNVFIRGNQQTIAFSEPKLPKHWPSQRMRGAKTLVADGRCLDIDVYHPERESIIIASWFVIFNLDDWHAFFGNDQEIRRLHL